MTSLNSLDMILTNIRECNRAFWEWYGKTLNLIPVEESNAAYDKLKECFYIYRELMSRKFNLELTNKKYEGFTDSQLTIAVNKILKLLECIYQK